MKHLTLLLIAISLSITMYGQKKFTVRIPYDATVSSQKYPQNQLHATKKPNQPLEYSMLARPNYKYEKDEEFKGSLINIKYKEIKVYIDKRSGDTIVVVPDQQYSAAKNTKITIEWYRAQQPFNAKLQRLYEDQQYFQAEKAKYFEWLQWKADELTRIEQKRKQDSINAVNHAIQQELESKLRAEKNAKQAYESMVGSLRFEFSEPAKLLTATKKLTGGATATYSYYVGNDGYEVKHGKYTVTKTYNNRPANSNARQEYGTETLVCNYRNGILHGVMTYNCNVTTGTVNKPKSNRKSYNLTIYKGFLSGNFKFEYKGITYTGNAINGILSYCSYQTIDGFHGKLTSNPKADKLSIAEINNGMRTFKFDIGIELDSRTILLPTFRFPLIGVDN